jgi:hypothetical protein
MICDIKFGTVSQSENITIRRGKGVQSKTPAFSANKFSMIRNSESLTPADNLFAFVPAKRSRIPTQPPYFCWGDAVWGLANAAKCGTNQQNK